MKRLLYRALLPVFCLLASCTHRTYQVSAVVPEALATHQTVAVLPFEVALSRFSLAEAAIASGTLPDSTAKHLRYSAEQRLRRRQLGYQLQEQVLGQLLRRQGSQLYSVRFQDPAETNRRLEQAGITYESLPQQPMAVLQAALGVDAVLSGQTTLHQPVPNAFAIAFFFLSDTDMLSQNEAATNLTIHDCHTGQLVWRFEHAVVGKLNNSPEVVAKGLVRNASRRFPYRR